MSLKFICLLILSSNYNYGFWSYWMQFVGLAVPQFLVLYLISVRAEVIMLTILCIILFRISSNFSALVMLQISCIFLKIILKTII